MGSLPVSPSMLFLLNTHFHFCRTISGCENFDFVFSSYFLTTKEEFPFAKLATKQWCNLYGAHGCSWFDEQQVRKCRDFPGPVLHTCILNLFGTKLSMEKYQKAAGFGMQSIQSGGGRFIERTLRASHDEWKNLLGPAFRDNATTYPNSFFTIV